MLRPEIERLVESIDAKNFSALSHGIGLGELKPKVQTGEGTESTAAAKALANARNSPVIAPRPMARASVRDGFPVNKGQAGSASFGAEAAATSRSQPVKPPPPDPDTWLPMMTTELDDAIFGSGPALSQSSPARFAPEVKIQPQPGPGSRPPNVLRQDFAPQQGLTTGGGVRMAPTEPLPGPPLRVPQGLSWRLFAWSLDFVFVAMCLGLAAALATVLSAVRSGNATSGTFGLPPLTWLMTTKPLVLVALTYGVFITYGLLFKLLAGRTFGETLVLSRLNRLGSAAWTKRQRGAP